jgi:DNA polymerase-3 subunit delta
LVIKPEQLPSKLAGELASVYLVAGAEPLLVQECRDQIIKAAQAQGFAERSVHESGRGFDWGALAEDSAAPSLFSSRKIIDVRLPTGKPGNDGAKSLIALAEANDPDVLLLVSSGAWSGAMRKLKWTTVLARAGVLVEIWPVKPEQLPAWIGARMRQADLEPDPDAVSLLAELAEGNLLAAQQEIEKLLLTDQGSRVSAQDVSRAAADSARFDSFRLVECALNGRLGESLRVASGLQRTGVAIQVVTGTLYRELMVAQSVQAALAAGQPESSAFSKLRIWPARQGPIRQMLGRLNERNFGQSFRALSLIDRQSKGRASGDAWQSLDRLLRFLCEPQGQPQL